jgi:hypothetical protein
MRSSIATLILALSSTAFADDLNADSVAAIRREQHAAVDKVNAAHGDKKPSEMSREERREIIQEQSKARLEVLERHGVSDKEFSRYEALLSVDQRAEAKKEDERLANKEKQQKEEAKKKAKKDDEPIPIQRGFGKNGQTVEMETKDGAPPIVEHGLPPEEQGNPPH